MFNIEKVKLKKIFGKFFKAEPNLMRLVETEDPGYMNLSKPTKATVGKPKKGQTGTGVRVSSYYNKIDVVVISNKNLYTLVLTLRLHYLLFL